MFHCWARFHEKQDRDLEMKKSDLGKIQKQVGGGLRGIDKEDEDWRAE